MIALLQQVVVPWWQWTVAMSLQVTLLGLTVLLLDRLLGRWSWPQLRAALWLAVVAKLLLPPTLSSPVGLWRLGPEGLAATAAPAPPAGALGTAVFGAWLLGLCALVVVAVRRYRRERARWLGGEPVPHPAGFADTLRGAAARLGLSRPPPVLVRRGAPGPAVVGFLRPVVVLPASLVETATSRQLEHVVLHELAHVRRRDPLAALVCLALGIVYWFHPLVWVAGRRLATLREIGCDEQVTRALRGEAGGYRRTLLHLARPLAHPGPAPLGFFHARGPLVARLRFLERPGARRPRLRRAVAATAFAVLVACAAPMARPPLPFVTPPLEELEGCLQLRYAVLGALAEEQRADHAATPSREDDR